MEFTTYIRKPFKVEAVRVTEQNIAEVAKSVGKLLYKDGKPYIQVNPEKIPNVTKVFPGYWMTKMDKQVRCYSGRVFKEQFVESDENLEELVDAINEDEDEIKNMTEQSGPG